VHSGRSFQLCGPAPTTIEKAAIASAKTAGSASLFAATLRWAAAITAPAADQLAAAGSDGRTLRPVLSRAAVR